MQGRMHWLVRGPQAASIVGSQFGHLLYHTTLPKPTTSKVFEKTASCATAAAGLGFIDQLPCELEEVVRRAFTAKGPNSHALAG